MRTHYGSRRLGRSIPCILLLASVAGCGSMLKNQIEQDVSVASACQEIQSNPAGYVRLDKAAFLKNLKARLIGEVVQCNLPELSDAEKLSMQSVLLCGIHDRIVLNAPAVIRENYKEKVLEEIELMRGDINSIRGNFEKLQVSFGECHDARECVKNFVRLADSQSARPYVTKIEAGYDALRGRLNKLQALLNNAEPEILNAAQQDEVQLLADAKAVLLNARNFLIRARLALTGDIAMTTRDAVLDIVYYQLSHRAIDNIEISLGRAEKLLDKADDKVYGAISIGMYFGKNGIQTAIDQASLTLVCRATDDRNEYIKDLAHAMAQAACERITDTTKSNSTYLAPMLEASWAKAVYASSDAKSHDDLALGCKDVRTRMNKTTKTQVDFSVASVKELMDKGKTFEIYMAHEWAAGLALTKVNTVEVVGALPMQATANKPSKEKKNGAQESDGDTKARSSTKPASGKDGAGETRRTTLVAMMPERSQVEALATKASAATIADLHSGPTAFKEQISYAANPGSLRTALESVRLTMIQNTQVNLQVNASQNLEVQQGSLHQSIYVAPPLAAPSLGFCSQLPSWVVCRTLPNGRFEIESPRFDNGKYKDEAVRNVLLLIARASKAMGRSYAAGITGFASSNEFDCAQVKDWIKQGGTLLFPGALASVNMQKASLYYAARQSPVTGGASCLHSAADGNQFLSFARAAWAASVFDETLDASIVVRGVIGVGAKYADRTVNMHDRKLVIDMSEQ